MEDEIFCVEKKNTEKNIWTKVENREWKFSNNKELYEL